MPPPPPRRFTPLPPLAPATMPPCRHATRYCRHADAMMLIDAAPPILRVCRR